MRFLCVLLLTACSSGSSASKEAPAPRPAAASAEASRPPTAVVKGNAVSVSADGNVIVSEPEALVTYAIGSAGFSERQRIPATKLGADSMAGLGAFALSPDGRRAAVVTDSFTVSIVDLATATVTRKLETPARDREL